MAKREKNYVSVIFMQLSVLFTVMLIASNIFATKEIAVIGPFNLRGGLLTFPLVYVICRIVCEACGFRRTCILIWMGVLLNFLFMALAGLVDMIPGVGNSEINSSFHAIFGFAPRITIASSFALLAGSFAGSYVLCRRKDSGNGKIAGRFALSAAAGEAADSLVFFPLAFIGVLTPGDMASQLLLLFVFKTLYEILLIPAALPVVKRIRYYETPDDESASLGYGLFDIFKRN